MLIARTILVAALTAVSLITLGQGTIKVRKGNKTEALPAPKPFDLVGVWDVYYSLELMDKPDSTKFTRTTQYIFKPNNTFEKEGYSIIMGKRYSPLYGIWSLRKQQLHLDQDDIKPVTTFPSDHKIYWLNEDCFYHVEREGASGPRVFTYYFRLPPGN